MNELSSKIAEALETLNMDPDVLFEYMGVFSDEVMARLRAQEAKIDALLAEITTIEEDTEHDLATLAAVCSVMNKPHKPEQEIHDTRHEHQVTHPHEEK